MKYQRSTSSGCKDKGLRKESDKDSIPLWFSLKRNVQPNAVTEFC